MFHSRLLPCMLCCCCWCSAVANLAVALLSLEESEGRLLDFLSRARSPLRKPLFDPKYALRLAKERNRCEQTGAAMCKLQSCHSNM
jgi:hypothetical protein